MFPMTAKTIMTEEAYRRFAWTNFWYKKNGLFSLILPEIVVLICGAICFFIGEPLRGVAFLVTVAVLPFLYYLSMNRHIKKFSIVPLTNNSSSSIRITLSGMIWSKNLASMRQTFVSLIGITMPDLIIKILWRL